MPAYKEKTMPAYKEKTMPAYKEKTMPAYKEDSVLSCPEGIKQISSSAQLRLKFILLINVKMSTIVGILTFISRINY